MIGCKAKPRDPDQGIIKPCPLKDKCWRAELYYRKRPPAGMTTIDGPYDFEDDECGQFKPK